MTRRALAVHNRVPQLNQKEKPDMAKTTEAQAQAFEAIAQLLRQHRGLIEPLEGPIGYDPGAQIKLPLDPTKMALRDARTVIDAAIVAEEEYNDFTRSYRYRPVDGAVATNKVLREIYGQVLGKKTWFADPQMISVEVAPGLFVSVPWGAIQLPPTYGAKAYLNIGSTRDATYGTVLQLTVSAIKRAQPEVDEIFDRVARELDAHSIYRGQAVTASEQPTFIDVSNVRRDNVVYAEHTGRRLEFRLFSVIEKEHIYVSKGDDGKKIVWVYGDYGVGKSETAKLLAAIAVDNGWTFVHVRPGVDSWDYAMQMARQYAPKVVVFVEDAEGMTGADNADHVSRMLDQLDGTEAKLLRQTLFVFTTNFIDKVHKAATRPGRADAIIRLGNLDRAGCERLAMVELGDMLAADVDYDQVYAAMGGAVLDEGGMPALDDKGKIIFKPEAELTPAFMRQAFNTAKMAAAINRGPRHKVTTADLLDGVVDLQEQLMIHRSGPEAKPAPTLDRSLQQALKPMVDKAVARQLSEFAPTIHEIATSAADGVVEHRIDGARINREENGSTWARVVTN
jgi:transitional endoplasmic reticulum ATPase